MILSADAILCTSVLWFWVLWPMSARPDAGRLGLHQRRRDAVGLAGWFLLPGQLVKGCYLVKQGAHIVGRGPKLTADGKYIMLFALGLAGNLPPLTGVLSPDDVPTFHRHFVYLRFVVLGLWPMSARRDCPAAGLAPAAADAVGLAGG
jgi:hypothetical protein